MLAAVVVDFVLGGGALPQLGVFHAAERSLDPVAYATIERAINLTPPALVLYPILGIGGAVVTCAALVVALRQQAARSIRIALGVAAAASLLVLAATTQAAPAVFQVGATPDDDPARLIQFLDRFHDWSLVRAPFIVLTFWATLAALGLQAMRRQEPR